VAGQVTTGTFQAFVAAGLPRSAAELADTRPAVTAGGLPGAFRKGVRASCMDGARGARGKLDGGLVIGN
jgi:hypothetical protein